MGEFTSAESLHNFDGRHQLAMIDPQRIWSSPQLPTLPTVAVRLLELSRNPETGLQEIVALVKSDPALAAKLLKAANSAFLGLSAKLTSVDRAVSHMGATMVTSLALSFSLSGDTLAKGVLADHYKQYWLQSTVQAAVAETLAGRFPGAQKGEHLLAGLLVDIGRLAMLKAIPEPYCEVLGRWSENPDVPLQAIETELLGFDHLRVGAELMRNWKLPESLQTCVARHHASRAELAELGNAPDAALVRSATLAAAIGDYFCSPAKGVAFESVRTLSQELLGWDGQTLQAELAQMKSRIDMAGQLLNVDTQSIPDPADLMAQANEQMAQLALRAQVAVTERQGAIEQEQRRLQEQNAQLLKQAQTDPLTGVFNRAFLDQALSQEILRCRRSGDSVGLIFTDVDKFKSLNDTYGHPFGDLVLKRVASCLRQTIRTSDILARYGGEEFVILIPHPTEKGLQIVAERVRARLEAEDIRHEDKRVPVTASFGAALTIPAPNDPEVASRLIASADEAMYEAKQSGRNCVRLRVVLKESDRHLLNLVIQQRFSRWMVSRGVLDIKTVSAHVVRCEAQKVPTRDVAQHLGLLTGPQAEQAVREQEKSQCRFGEAAMSLGFLTELQLAWLLAVKQENPDELASRLIQSGALDASRGKQLVQDYMAERCPTARVATSA